MDRLSRKMLAFMKTSDVCKDGYCHFGPFYDAFCPVAKCTEQEAMACIRYLESTGYICIGKDQFGASVGFELEHRAHHVFYFSVRDNWHFIRNSVLIPVLVAFFTSVLTADLWPRLRPLLREALTWFLQWLK